MTKRKQSASLPKPKAKAARKPAGSSRIGVSDATASVSPAWARLQQKTDEPKRPRVTRIDGCDCVAPERTGHVPGCERFDESLYVCEEADQRTIAILARGGGLTIAELERRRLDYAKRPADCPALVEQDEKDPRRRCWNCPRWEEGDVPF